MRPLVPLGPPLTTEQTVRYARHLSLAGFGEEAQRRLLGAKVLAVGAGGLGSPALLYLAAAGVGTLGVIDDDRVDRTNLQRQVLHTDAGVGEPKTASAARAITALNPEVTVIEHRERLGANAEEILSGYDLVLDGTDNFATRYTVDRAATALGMPEVWGSIFQFCGQVSVFWSGQEAVAAGAPGPDGVTLRDLFPSPPPPGQVPSCGEAGVLGALPGQVGTIMAIEAIKLICGIGEPLLGRVQVIDTLAGTSHTVPLAPRPEPRPAPIEDVELAPYCSAPVVPAIDMTRIDEVLASGADVLDVREDAERAAGFIPGSRHIPLASVLADPEGAASGTVYVYCAAGARSAKAVAALRERGIDAINVTGGYAAYKLKESHD